MLLKIVPRTFRMQIILLFGILSFLIALPTYWYINSEHRKQQIEHKRERLLEIARAASTVLSESLAERMREIVLLTQNPLYRESSLSDAKMRLNMEQIRDSYTHYSWIGVADTEGRVEAATSKHLEGLNVSKRPWFAGALKGPFLGDVHEALLLAKLLPNRSDQPIRFIDFAAPIYDESGKLKGVLGAHAHWQWAGTMLADVTPPQAARDNIEVFIVNNKDEVIYPEVVPENLKVPTANELANSAIKPFLTWGGNTRFLTAVAPVISPKISDPLGWKVVVRQNESIALAQVNDLIRINLLTMLLAGVAFIVLAWLVANRISRPVEALTKVARRIESGEKNVHFSAKFWAQELQRLSDALRGMASTLIKQKEELAESNQNLEAKVAARTTQLQDLNVKLEQLARTDTLTGLPNRMSTNEKLATEFALFKRTHVPYSVLVLDIDFFKRINDTFGHAVGDAVLQHVANLLRTTIRKTDFVGRTGGEEFIAVLPTTKLWEAANVAEKIRSAIASTLVAPVGNITASIGVEEVKQSDVDEEGAVTRADAFMYEAKAAGRNRVKPELVDQ